LIYADPDVVNLRERDNQLQIAVQEAAPNGPENPTVKHLQSSETDGSSRSSTRQFQKRACAIGLPSPKKIREVLTQKQTQIDRVQQADGSAPC